MIVFQSCPARRADLPQTLFFRLERCSVVSATFFGIRIQLYQVVVTAASRRALPPLKYTTPLALRLFHRPSLRGATIIMGFHRRWPLRNTISKAAQARPLPLLRFVLVNTRSRDN